MFKERYFVEKLFPVNFRSQQMSDISLSWTCNIIGHLHRISSNPLCYDDYIMEKGQFFLIFRFRAWIYSYYAYAWCMITIESEDTEIYIKKHAIVMWILLSCRGNCNYMQRRLTIQIFYRQVLWSFHWNCRNMQLINLIASMYDYTK